MLNCVLDIYIKIFILAFFFPNLTNNKRKFH
nr:MAG TPA: hypothetical protein [Caudoviricetes sp.]